MIRVSLMSILVFFLLGSQWVSSVSADPVDEFTTPFDFGAIGDGVADDSAALQSALNTGKVVQLPSAKYRLTQQLTIPQGGGLSGPGILLVTADIGRALFTQADHVTLDGFEIRKTFVDGSYGVGIAAENVSQLTIRNVEISGYSARYGIHIVESDDFEVTGCYIHDFMMNTTADMIQDSPAGLRITRSGHGIVSNNRIERIEVGPVGRASISPLVPSYGPQKYQSDCITLQQSHHVVVSNNLLVTSGEGLDMLLSQSCTATNNVISDIWFQGIKMLGVSFCAVNGNFLSDCYQGIGLAAHPAFNAEASANTVNGNVLRDIGSPGSFGEASSIRSQEIPNGIHGILLASPQGCRRNIITDNVIVDTQLVKTTESGVKGNGDSTNLVSGNVFTTDLTSP